MYTLNFKESSGHKYALIVFYSVSNRDQTINKMLGPNEIVRINKSVCVAK